jgi:hypothetical protein
LPTEAISEGGICPPKLFSEGGICPPEACATAKALSGTRLAKVEPFYLIPDLPVLKAFPLLRPAKVTDEKKYAKVGFKYCLTSLHFIMDTSFCSKTNDLA